MESDPRSTLTLPTVYITGHNEKGEARVQSSTKEETEPYPNLRTSGRIVYTTSKFPPELAGDEDIILHQAVLEGGKLGLVNLGGTVCRIVNFGPKKQCHDA